MQSQIDLTTTGGMPLRKVRKKKTLRPAASGHDTLIGDLPDDALHRVLSFLPAQDAVQTCVLARRWRHIWKSAPGLRILCGGRKHRKFADNLLRVRGTRPIDTCEFRLLELDAVDVHRVDLWIRHVLRCRVRVLRIHKVRTVRGYLINRSKYLAADLPLISQHLKKLQLHYIDCTGFLDFSCCRVLEDLEIHGCDLSVAKNLSSQSLKRLSIGDDCQFPKLLRMDICTPNLVSLGLKVHGGSTTPSFEGIPLLVEAVVEINNNDWGHVPVCSEFCDDFHCSPRGNCAKCFLLPSLSEAQSLVLIGYDTQSRERRDLEFYPTFNKLKTLHLNEYRWESPDFSSLARLLEHSPVLEKLTLQQLYSMGLNYKVELKLSCKPVEKSAVSEHLSTVEIKCKVMDEQVRNLLKFLGKLNIWFQFI